MPISRLEPAHFDAIQPLFRQVFGHDISRDLLDWKYGADHGEAWGYWSEDGALMLHCGLFYRNIRFAGQQYRIGQLADLMAAPKHAGLTRRDAPFTQLMREILAHLAGPANPHALAVGFPGERAMRLGEHLGVYKAIDDWHELSFHARPAGFLAPRATNIETMDPATGAVVDRLWAAMARDLADFPLGLRDAAYIEQRYFRHPTHRHHCLLIQRRWPRRPLALAVLRGEGEQYELLDLVGPLTAMPEALRCLQAWLGQVGGQRLSFWLTSRFAEQFAPLADASRVTEIRIMANPDTPPEILASFDHRWWLTGGDTDYR